MQYVSSTPATRLDVITLQEKLDQQLQQRQVVKEAHAFCTSTADVCVTCCELLQARETGICPVREELYAQCFDELIREVTINCAERGLLLLRVRDEMHMTIAAYQVPWLKASLLCWSHLRTLTQYSNRLLTGSCSMLAVCSHGILSSGIIWRMLQTLYESSIAFGMRKALQTEQGKGDMEGRIGTLEADTKDFERQVRLQYARTTCHKHMHDI